MYTDLHAYIYIYIHTYIHTYTFRALRCRESARCCGAKHINYNDNYNNKTLQQQLELGYAILHYNYNYTTPSTTTPTTTTATITTTTTLHCTKLHNDCYTTFTTLH